MCLSNPINIHEFCDGLKPITDMHEIDPKLRILINLALSSQAPMNQ
jgi:hypothetical protein